MTPAGMWTNKGREALSRGAAAVLFIHTDESAGFAWPAVQALLGREQLQLVRKPEEPALGLEGFLSQEAGERLLGLAGRSLSELTAQAGAREFKAIPLGVRLDGVIPSKVRPVTAHNIVAMVPGSDPALRSEAVIYCAHWDHLGVGPEADGDGIYNGAQDNATGTAILLELARAWAALEKKPKRSALFLAVTAEEPFLLGSSYYTGNPVLPLRGMMAAINLDAYQPLGALEGLRVHLAERATLWRQARDAARRLRLDIEPRTGPDFGDCCRSDHYSFAAAGIPSFSVEMTGGFTGEDEEWLAAMRERNGFHQPGDEYREDWDFTGLATIGEYGFLLGRMIAELEDRPSWDQDAPFPAER